MRHREEVLDFISTRSAITLIISKKTHAFLRPCKFDDGTTYYITTFLEAITRDYFEIEDKNDEIQKHELLFVEIPKMKYNVVKYANMDIDIDTIKQCNRRQRIYKT